MDNLEDFVMQRAPSVDRPLAGLTLLVVEDSRFACEAIRLMCLRSGARIRRADSLRAAARHLRVYQPSVAIVDVGLPDGSGLSLIGDLASCSPRIGVILGTSGDAGVRAAAKSAGADGFLQKPVASLAEFQECILRHLPPEAQPRAPRAVPDEVLTPDRLALKDDLAQVFQILGDKADGQALDYVAQFVGGLAISAQDKPLLSAARALRASLGGTGATVSAVDQLTAILQDRLTQDSLV